MKQTIVILSGIPGTSPVFGLRVLARAFEALGYETVTLDTSDGAIKDKIITLVDQKNVSFFLSHNLKGCDITCESNGQQHFFYDLFDKWFITIVDTPLNKIDTLRQAGKKKILLFLDKAFVPLVEKVTHPETVIGHFPAVVIDDCAFDEKRYVKDTADRNIDVLFVGRVGANVDFISGSKNLLREIAIRKIVKKAFYPQGKQIYEICIDVLKTSWFLRSARLFRDPCSAEFLFFNWGLSNLVRTKRRIRVLEELAVLPRHVKIVIATNDSYGIRKKFESNVEILPFQEWTKVVALMDDAKIVVNVQPFHIYGSHERLLTAMAHGCVAATDKNRYLEERFKDGQDLMFYEFTKGSLSQQLSEYLGDTARIRAIAIQGMQKVVEKDLAIQRARDIIALVNRVSAGGQAG